MVECSGRQVYDLHVNIKWAHVQMARSSLTDEGPSQRVKPKQGSGADTTAHGHTDHGRYFLPHSVHVKGMPPGVSGHISQARLLVSGHYLLPSAQLPTVRWGTTPSRRPPPRAPFPSACKPTPRTPGFMFALFRIVDTFSRHRPDVKADLGEHLRKKGGESRSQESCLCPGAARGRVARTPGVSSCFLPEVPTQGVTT